MMKSLRFLRYVSEKSRRGTITSLLLAVLSGCLWFLACADFDIWPFAWIASVPHLYLVLKAPTLRRAMLYSFVCGWVASIGGFYWISLLLERFGHFPPAIAYVGLLLLAAYQAMVFLLFGRILRRIVDHAKTRGITLPMSLAAPVVMVALEYAWPLLFPFQLAITQAWNPTVIQIADITGVYGVSFLLMLSAGGIYDLLTLPASRFKWKSLSMAAGLLLVALGYGVVRKGQIEVKRENAEQVRVGIVQGNVPFDEKAIGNPHLAQKQLNDLQTQSAKLEAQGAELLVWTESAYPYALSRTQTKDFSIAHESNPHSVFAKHRRGQPISRREQHILRRQQWDSTRRIRRGFTAPLLMGSLSFPEERDALPYNSALLVYADDSFSQFYDKIFLLMFGEYTPLSETFPALKKLAPKNAGHFTRGKEKMVFPLNLGNRELRLAPQICYEDILPSFNRDLASKRPNLFVNITNDAWFGNTSEPWEHLALSVYRSVENRVDMVRAVNTGVSALISATGEVLHETYAVDPLLTPAQTDGLIGDMALIEAGQSFYSRFGDIFSILMICITLWGWLVWPRLARSS